MAYRQLIINKNCHLSFSKGSIIVNQDDYLNKLPLVDITQIIIDSSEVTLTAALIAECGSNNVNIITCGTDHIPKSLSISINSHYRPYEVIDLQIRQTDEMKAYFAELLLKQKVFNQLSVIKLLKRSTEDLETLFERYINEIQGNDVINREGTAAKVFFNNVYGKEFVRFEEDIINSALNYGYGILRSSITRSINSFGLCAFIGVNHVGKTNPLNLTYDIIEPFRPLVDYYVATNILELTDGTLNTIMRKEMVNLLNANVMVDNKIQTVQNAIDLLVKSYLRYIEYGEIDFQLPYIIEIDFNKLNEFL